MRNDVPLNPGNPDEESSMQEGFQTFGGPHVLSLLVEAQIARLKPSGFTSGMCMHAVAEAYGGLVHSLTAGNRKYPLHSDVLNSQGVAKVFSKYGSYLLPQAFPEGSPQHPRSGQGLLAIAGARNHSESIFQYRLGHIFQSGISQRRWIVAGSLQRIGRVEMSVTNELDKLAGNIGMARNLAGVTAPTTIRRCSWGKMSR